MLKSLCFLFVWFFITVPVRGQSWEKLGFSGGRINGVFSLSGSRVLISTTQGGAVLRSDDGGEQWRLVCTVENSDRSTVFSAGAGRIFLASGRSVYSSDDGGTLWRKTGSLRVSCNAIAWTPFGLFVGDDAGVYAGDDGHGLRAEPGIAGRCHALAFSAGYSCIFAASDDGIYGRRLPSGVWQKLYSTVSAGDAAPLDGADDPAAISPVNSVCCLADGTVIAATRNGIIVSGDCRNWMAAGPQRISGLILVTVSGSSCLAAGSHSSYLYETGRWKEISAGWPGKTVHAVSSDGRSVYAAFSDGIFRCSVDEGQERSAEFRDGRPEPGDLTIQELHREAISYNEMNNGKIASWRSAVRKKAWLPKVSMGMGSDTADLWHWETGSTSRECDDALRKGRGTLDWDVSLSWELGDLIWSGEQVSIDTRSRLMVELREDILDRVNKLYFERLRLIGESSGKFSPRQKELRIRELEAGLDSLTGGYFSRESERRRKAFLP